MTFSFLAAFITTPIMLNVILFEANCHNRTLINRLISSDFESAFCWNLLVQTLIFARYIYGPLPVFFCQMEYLIKNVLINKVILFLNFIIIIRYIFMFKTKNPTAIQDSFWLLFLSLWSIGFALTCQTTLLIYPCKEPMMFYFCVGKMPISLTDVKVKNNILFNVLALLTLLFHVCITVKLTIHEYKQNQGTVQFVNVDLQPNCINIQNMILDKMKQENLFTLTTNTIAIVTLTMSAVVPHVINQIDPTHIATFPNYIWVYVHHHITGSVGLLAINIIHYYKRPLLLPFFIRNVKEIFKIM